MSPKLTSFLRKNWLLVGLLLGGLVVALWLASRLMLDALYFNDPRNVDVDLKPWMTPRYVVMTYDLPRDVVADMLGLTSEADRRKRLGRLADERGMTMETLTQSVRDAAAEYRETQE